jgi:hypothetical protein
MKRIPLWLRVVITGFLVVAAIYICLVIVGSQSASELPDDIIKRGLDKNTAERKTEWGEKTFQVYTGSQQDPLSVKGKTATFSAIMFNFRNRRSDAKVTAFVTENGRVWAGPEEKYYIETKSDVVGISVNGQCIQWTDTMVPSRRSEKLDVDRVVQVLEKEIQARGIVGLFKFFQGKNVTSFAFIEEFNGLKTDSGEEYHLEKKERPIQVTGDIARLELSSQYGTTGTLWVNINTRKLQKAAYNGKLVFTKWWPW